MKDTRKDRSNYNKLPLIVFTLSLLLVLSDIYLSINIIDFGAFPEEIELGESSTLYWDVNGANDVVIDQGLGIVPTKGSMEIYPSETTVYTLFAKNIYESRQKKIKVIVTAPAMPVITRFDSNLETINKGNASLLYWDVYGANNIYINHGIGEVYRTGDLDIYPSETTTYTLTATNKAGSISRQVKIEVLSPKRTNQPAIKDANSMPERNVTIEGYVNPESNFIENFVKNLEEGRLIYNPPENMTVNITESINATIIKGEISGEQINLIESNNITIIKGEISGEQIKLAPCMEVDLTGSAFKIAPITERRQFIASDSPTIWKWDVTPRKIGNQTLDLSAYVIIKMRDGREEKRALVKSKTIHVHVNPDEKKGILSFIPELFSSPWTKPIAALSAVLAFLITFFKGYILEWIRSRKKKTKTLPPGKKRDMRRG
jgi:hypothetical protein